MKDEDLVRRILDAAVAAVDVLVTLKIRTGWNPGHHNGAGNARLAENTGIAAFAVPGRPRYGFYGAQTGVRIARKHLGWYLRGRPGGEEFWRIVVRLDIPREQSEATRKYVDGLIDIDMNQKLAA